MLVNGYADSKPYVGAINQGPSPFLKKPWQQDEMENAVRAAADELRLVGRHREETRRFI